MGTIIYNFIGFTDYCRLTIWFNTTLVKTYYIIKDINAFVFIIKSTFFIQHLTTVQNFVFLRDQD